MRKRDAVGMLPWVLGESMGKSCDEELFAQLVAGDRECLRPLMERHGDALTLYVNGYIHDIDAAEDLMIEAFARMLAKRPRLREGGFKSYLYKTARNLALRHVREDRAALLGRGLAGEHLARYAEALERAAQVKRLGGDEGTQRIHE